jgi:hypothetical protein
MRKVRFDMRADCWNRRPEATVLISWKVEEGHTPGSARPGYVYKISGDIPIYSTLLYAYNTAVSSEKDDCRSMVTVCAVC